MPQLRRAQRAIWVANGALYVLLATGGSLLLQSRYWQHHSAVVMDTLQHLRNDSTQARDAFEDYLRTNQPGKYQAGLTTLYSDIDQLEKLTSDNKAQVANLSNLKQLLTPDTENLQKNLFDSALRHQFAEIGTLETVLLSQRSAWVDKTLVVVAIGCVSSLFVSSWATRALGIETAKRARTQRELEVRTAEIEAIAESIPSAILLRKRGTGECLRVLGDREQLLMLPKSEMIGKTPADIMTPEVAFQISVAMEKAYAQGKTIHDVEYQVRLPDNRLAWLSSSISPVPKLDACLIVVSDATEEHYNTRRLITLATTDYLTGLANRRFFVDAVDVEISYQKRHWNKLEKGFGLCLIDIDDFKSINEKYSHAGGDLVLTTIGKVLKENIRKSDLAARLGGDEAAILLKDVNVDGAIAAAEKIREAIQDSQIVFRGERVPATVTAGIALYNPGKCETFEDLFQAASEVLLAGKKKERDRVYAAS